MMRKYCCISKERDIGGKVVSFTIIDIQGNIEVISTQKFRELLEDETVNIVNMYIEGKRIKGNIVNREKAIEMLNDVIENEAKTIPVNQISNNKKLVNMTVKITNKMIHEVIRKTKSWACSLKFKVVKDVRKSILYCRTLGGESDYLGDSAVLGYLKLHNDLTIISNNKMELAEGFSGLDFMKSIDLRGINIGTNLFQYFANCTDLVTVNFTGIDLSKVVNMEKMFYNCNKLRNIIIDTDSLIDLTNVITMSKMFEGCNNLVSSSVEFLNRVITDKLEYMDGMFYGCRSLDGISFGDYFDTSNVSNMSSLFSWCSSLKEIHFGEFFNTGNVVSMAEMFVGCLELGEIDFNRLDVSKVSNFYSMFLNAHIAKLDIHTWDMREATNLVNMFRGCKVAGEVKIGVKQLNRCRCISMNNMFNGCGMEQLDLSHIILSSNRLNAIQHNNMFKDIEIDVLDISGFGIRDMDIFSLSSDKYYNTKLVVSNSIPSILISRLREQFREVEVV